MRRALSFADASFDAYTIVFGIRNVTDIPAALREAHRVLKRGGRFYCMEFSSSDWPGFSNLYDAWASNVIPRIGKAVARRRGELPLSRRKHPPLPAPERVQGDGRGRGIRPRRGRADARRAGRRSIRAGRFERPSSVTHLWRLLKWGRTLARHGALTRHRARSADSAAGAAARAHRPLRRAQSRRRPNMPTRWSAIGPAAIKLGQALSTRPDLVGEGSRGESVAASGRPAARALPADQADDRASFGAPLESLFSQFDEKPVGAASIAQVHRAITTEGREVAVKVLRPGIEEEFAKAIETYEWAAAQVESYGGEAAAATSAPGRRPVPSMDRARARPSARSGLGLRTQGEYGRGARLLRARDRLAPNRAASAHARMARRDQAQRPRSADRSRPGLRRAREDAGARFPSPGSRRRLLPRRPPPRKSVRAAGRADRRDRLRDHGPDRPPRARSGSPRSSTASSPAITAASPRSTSRRNMCRRTTASRNSRPRFAPPASRSAGFRSRTSRSGECSKACSRSPATSTCRRSRTCCSSRRRW